MRVPKNSVLYNSGTKLVAITNAKGGAGKSLLAECIARVLADRRAGGKERDEIKRRILLIDADGQANLTEAFRFRMEDIPPERCCARLFDERPLNLDDIILYDVVPGLDLIPSHIQAIIKEQEITERIRRGYPGYSQGFMMLKKFEQCHRDLEDYDYIIIDTNPYMGSINSNILSIADSYIAPVDNTNALIGLLTTIKMWNEYRRIIFEGIPESELEDYEYLKEEYDNPGIVLNKYQSKSKVGKTILRILEGKDMSEREDQLFGDFHERFIGPPVPLKSIMASKDITEKNWFDCNDSDTRALKETLNQLVDNLIREEIL